MPTTAADRAGGLLEHGRPRTGRPRRRGWKVLLRRRLSLISAPIVFLLFLAAWQLYISTADVSPLVLPPPSDVGSAFADTVTQSYVWKDHVWTTFYEAVLGFALGAGLGLVVGFITGKSPTVHAIASPWIVATQVIPKVALVPLFILWFGFGPTSKVGIAALLAFFPVLTNTALGVRSVPRGMKEMMQSIGAGKLDTLRRLELPFSLPYVLAGAEVGIILAMIGAIVGEYLAGERGLGRYIVNLQNSLKVPELYAAILLTALFGLTLYLCVVAVRRLLIPWHESVRASKDIS